MHCNPPVAQTAALSVFVGIVHRRFGKLTGFNSFLSNGDKPRGFAQAGLRMRTSHGHATVACLASLGLVWPLAPTSSQRSPLMKARPPPVPQLVCTISTPLFGPLWRVGLDGLLLDHVVCTLQFRVRPSAPQVLRTKLSCGRRCSHHCKRCNKEQWT